MITLYHCVSARSFRPLWLLEELGLPYTLHMLPFPPRALARTYLEENPLGTVPLLVDGDITPTAFHCTTGKDRTGWLAASFLSILGVSREDVYTEYLLTNSRLVPALQPLLDQLVKVGADEDALKLVLGVDKSYLDTAFDLVDKQWGTIEKYFSEGLGIDDDAQQKLREKYLVDPS